MKNEHLVAMSHNIDGSNPYGSEGRELESSPARHLKKGPSTNRCWGLFVFVVLISNGFADGHCWS